MRFIGFVWVGGSRFKPPLVVTSAWDILDLFGLEGANSNPLLSVKKEKVKTQKIFFRDLPLCLFGLGEAV